MGEVDPVEQARRIRDKVAVAERALQIEPAAPDPVQPVLVAAHGVPVEQRLVEQLRILPGEVVEDLARWINRIWWAGRSTRPRGWRR